MRHAGVLLAAAALAAASATSARAQGAACGKLLPPANGIYFGSKPGWAVNPPTYDDVVDASKLDAFEGVGRKTVFATFSVTWHDGLRFPAAQVRAVWGHGQIPLVRIFSFPREDFGQGAPPESTYPGPITSGQIALGQHDAELRAWADAARDLNIPLGLDYDPEMNNAHPWGGRFEGAGATTGYGDPSWPDGPERFRDAYRRLITIFREEGATNVTFFFHPDTVYGYSDGGYTKTFERYRWYYPGNDYIDWLGFSLYANPIKPDRSHASFEEKLQTFHAPDYEGSYAELTALGDKPVALNEFGLNTMTESQKAAWVADAAAVLASGKYGRIRAVNWWADNQGGAYDAWPGSSQVFGDAFRAAFGAPLFDAAPQLSGNCLPAAPAHAVRKHGRLSWQKVPNATAYEVWRGAKRVATTEVTAYLSTRKGPYRVRAVNPLGFGPFAPVRG